MKSTIQFIKKYKTVISSAWAVLTTLLSFYLGFFPIEQNPKLTLYEKSKFDLFAIDKPIEELQIILNGVDLKEKKHNLKVFQFKLINNGKRDIRTSDYSAEIPFGLRIKNGKLVKIDIGKNHRTLTAKNLLKRCHPDSSKIDFNKIFLGKNEYILLELWVEYENNKEPLVSISGKIADTTITASDKEESQFKSIWDDFILPLLLLLAGIFVFSMLVKLWNITYKSITRFIRHQILLKKFDHHYDKTNRRHRLIAKIFTLFDKSTFIEILKQLIDKDEVKRVFNQEVENDSVVDTFNHLVKTKRTNLSPKESSIIFDSPFLEVIFLLQEADLVKISETDNEYEDLQIEIDSQLLSDMEFALKLIEGYEE